MGILDAFSSAEKLSKKILKEFKGVEGLEETVEEIMGLGDSEIYWKYFQAFKLEKVYVEGVDFKEDEKKNIRLINLAQENLSNPALNIPSITDLIEFMGFYVIYRIIEDIYYVYIGRKLTHDDLINVFYGKIDEHVIFALDKFDEVSNIPEPSAEFFLKLKKVNWNDKKTKKLYGRLHRISCDIFIEKRRTVSNKFTATENAFLLFLAGCSAVNDDRVEINENDVIRAYKTYFKLLNTDITKLV
ncbi:MAG: hypothetical protein HZC47_08870 [Methanobacterium sp.]|uniref:hypothetical protein n=1 Tax=Methanobacterium sp. TaxID=2164 RepID=UPI003D65C0E9|nr:hypothetical protein [Methanobacterium sp.]